MGSTVPEKSSFMDRWAKKSDNHPKLSLTLFIFSLLLIALSVAYGGWLWGLAGILILYAFLNFYIFCTIRPREWEGSILFIGFIVVALLFIMLFAVIYDQGNLVSFEKCAKLADGSENCGPDNTIWNRLYYSTVVFTGLGFGEITPKDYPGKFATSVEAILGMAYAVTSVIVFLGRHSWAASTNNARNSVSTQPSHTNTVTNVEVTALLKLMMTQSTEIADIRNQLSIHITGTAARLNNLKHWLCALTGLAIILGLAFVCAITSSPH